MAGDPCQLPPVIASPSAITPAPVMNKSLPGTSSQGAVPGNACAGAVAGHTFSRAGSGSAHAGTALGKVTHGAVSGSAPAVATTAVEQGLARPLLVRLIQLGHSAHLLRRQYR